MTVYYETGGWKVTDRLVRTPKKTFALEKLDGVSVKRSTFLLVAAPATGAILLAALWWRYLYVGEIAFILIASLAALLVSFQFGTLKVEALSFKDDEGGVVFGWFSQLATVRDAVERAIQERGDDVSASQR